MFWGKHLHVLGRFLTWLGCSDKGKIKKETNLPLTLDPLVGPGLSRDLLEGSGGAFLMCLGGFWLDAAPFSRSPPLELSSPTSVCSRSHPPTDSPEPQLRNAKER